MKPSDHEPAPSVVGSDASKNRLDHWIHVVSSGVDRYTWKVAIGYVILTITLLMIAAVLGMLSEESTDDTAGVIKNYRDVAAESTVTLESFDPDLQNLHASVEVRPPLFVTKEMNAVKKLNLPNEAALKQVAFQLGKLNVRDVVLNFKLDGIKLDLLDLGPPLATVNADKWKSEVPQVVKDVELTAEGNPRLYPFDTYLVIARLDLPFRMSYQQNSVDVLWKNYHVKSRLGGLLIEALDLGEIKDRANDRKTSVHGGGKRPDEQQTALDKEEAELTKEAEGQAQALYELSPENAWIASRFVIEIHRPFLFRILAMLLIINAIAFSLWIAFKTEPKDYISSAAGYLVAMWAAKSILGGQAPKLPSLMDYVIVFLFFFQTFVIAIRAYAARHMKHPPAGFAGGMNS